MLLGYDDDNDHEGESQADRDSHAASACRRAEAPVDDDGTHEETATTVREVKTAKLLNASAAFNRLLPLLTLGEDGSEWAYLSSIVVGGDEAARRVAERLMWLRLETEHAAAATASCDYVARLNEVLRGAEDGSCLLAPYASVLSPALLERRQLLNVGKLLSEAPATTGVEPTADEKRECVAALWADVLGM